MKDPTQRGLPPGAGIRIFSAAILVIGGVAIGVYAFTQRGSAVNHGARVAVTVFGILMPLFFFAVAYGILRVVFPPSMRGVTLTLSNSDVRRGADIDLRAEVAKPDKMLARLEFGLVCTEYYDVETTDGRGNRSRTTKQVDTHVDWRPFTGGPAQTERFHIPDDGPFSYRGNCLSYGWRASARLPKRLRFDPAENVPFVVRP
jgi:hypothetical protein